MIIEYLDVIEILINELPATTTQRIINCLYCNCLNYCQRCTHCLDCAYCSECFNCQSRYELNYCK